MDLQDHQVQLTYMVGDEILVQHSFPAPKPDLSTQIQSVDDQNDHLLLNNNSDAPIIYENEIQTSTVYSENFKNSSSDTITNIPNNNTKPPLSQILPENPPSRPAIENTQVYNATEAISRCDPAENTVPIAPIAPQTDDKESVSPILLDQATSEPIFNITADGSNVQIISHTPSSSPSYNNALASQVVESCITAAIDDFSEGASSQLQSVDRLCVGGDPDELHRYSPWGVHQQLFKREYIRQSRPLRVCEPSGKIPKYIYERKSTPYRKLMVSNGHNTGEESSFNEIDPRVRYDPLAAFIYEESLKRNIAQSQVGGGRWTARRSGRRSKVVAKDLSQSEVMAVNNKKEPSSWVAAFASPRGDLGERALNSARRFYKTAKEYLSIHKVARDQAGLLLPHLKSAAGNPLVDLGRHIEKPLIPDCRMVVENTVKFSPERVTRLLHDRKSDNGPYSMYYPETSVDTRGGRKDRVGVSVVNAREKMATPRRPSSAYGGGTRQRHMSYYRARRATLRERGFE